MMSPLNPISSVPYMTDLSFSNYEYKESYLLDFDAIQSARHVLTLPGNIDVPLPDCWVSHLHSSQCTYRCSTALSSSGTFVRSAESIPRQNSLSPFLSPQTARVAARVNFLHFTDIKAHDEPCKLRISYICNSFHFPLHSYSAHFSPECFSSKNLAVDIFPSALLPSPVGNAVRQITYIHIHSIQRLACGLLIYLATISLRNSLTCMYAVGWKCGM